MGHQTGAGAAVMIGFQSDINTIATEGFILAVNSCGVKASRNQNPAGTIRNNLNPSEPFDGNATVAGAMAVPVDSIQTWYILKALLGDPATSGIDPYDHEFKAGNTRPYITIEDQFTELGTSKYFQYIGCKINSMSMSLGSDGELIATLNIVGSSRTIATSSFDSSPTTLGFSRLKNNQLSMKEGGSTISNATLADLTISFNCDTTKYVIGGGGTLGSIPDGVMSVTGNLTTLFEDTTLLEKAANSTESSLEWTLTDSASSILVIKFPELKYTQNDPGIDGPQGLLVSLPFSAYYEDATEATSVVATLTNEEAHA